MNVRSYLGELEQVLHLEPHQRSEILAEIQTHVEERAGELEDHGLPPEAALERAIREVGDPHTLAKGLYSSHSTGTWRDIFLATLPHLLLASIFAFHLWTELLWVVVALGGATFIAILAWRMGRPQWTYPWLGYALAVPALSWAMAMAAIGYGIWAFVTGGELPLALPIYIGIALWVPISFTIIIRVVRQAVRQDWLVVSLAALPLPFIATWFFLLHWRGGQLVPDKPRAMQTDSDTAIIFVALAIITALYLRLGRRSLRLALMMVAASALIAVIAVIYQTHPPSWSFRFGDVFAPFGIQPEAAPVAFFTVGLAIVLTVAFLLSPFFLGAEGLEVLRRYRSFYHHRANPLTP